MNGSARKKLRTFQAANGMSDYRLAQLLQISRSGLSRVLYHGAQPTLPVAAKIEEGTGGAVRVSDWLTSNQRRSAQRAGERVRSEVSGDSAAA